MDLGWCPVCDKQTFAIENLYCSEACRKKDETTILDEKYCYEFPRRSVRRLYQSPYTSPYNTPVSSPRTSPKLYPTNTTMTMICNFQSTYTMSSTPSDLLLYGLASSSSVTNRTVFFNNTVNSSIMKPHKP